MRFLFLFFPVDKKIIIFRDRAFLTIAINAMVAGKRTLALYFCCSEKKIIMSVDVQSICFYEQTPKQQWWTWARETQDYRSVLFRLVIRYTPNGFVSSATRLGGKCGGSSTVFEHVCTQCFWQEKSPMKVAMISIFYPRAASQNISPCDLSHVSDPHYSWPCSLFYFINNISSLSFFDLMIVLALSWSMHKLV